MRIAGQLILHRIHPAVSEAYQSMIGQRILTSNLRVHDASESKLQRIWVTYTLEKMINLLFF